MKKAVKGVLAMSLGLSLLGATTSASASSQYSASRSNSVRLAWRTSMGRHALSASTGARYSEHLGIRYGYNSATPNTVWYTNAHEELIDKATGSRMIYYHVNNASESSGGWIWRGYLKPAKSTSKTSTTNANSSSSSTPTTTNQQVQTSPATEPISSANWSQYEAQEIGLTADDATVMSQFPNTIYDQRIFDGVQGYLSLGDNEDIGEYDTTTPGGLEMFEQLATDHGVSVKQFKVIQFRANDPSNAASIDQGLANAGFDANARSQYQGWYIGGGDIPMTSDQHPGDGLVLLVQE